MFVNVGRFRFRPMSQDERQNMIQRVADDVPPIARESPGFRGVYFVRTGDDEVMAVWFWDSAADWDAALPRFGPGLQEYVIPNLAQPPERVGGDVVFQVTP
jgi:hypothetical protein